MDKRRKIELLAPAKTADIGIQAIIHGADAVYIGASHHGARAAAGNSIEDISRLVRFAHAFRARVYVTVNTIIYDNELDDVKSLIQQLYRIGVDALIVQDMALLEMDLPPIALHASTQCDIQDAEKARFLSAAGFSQLVLARELSLNEIAAIHKAINTPLEAFVHGALCVSYSGDCQAGFMAMRRSANRGECPQICRLAYDLYDGLGNKVVSQKHLLSLKDMNRLDYLEEMIEAGVSSFKIEGRLKDEAYVKTVVAVYRQALDKILKENGDKYVRSSLGISEYFFKPNIKNTFNRGFTPYFMKDLRPIDLSSMDTPKSIGIPVAKVLKCVGNSVKVSAQETINNGDGLGYFGDNGVFSGFRVNRVERDTLILRKPVELRSGTVLYRNRSVRADAELSKETALRYIPVHVTLRRISEDRLSMDVCIISDNITACATIEYAAETAKTSQYEARKRVLSKLGDTVYRLEELDDKLGNIFVPASVLTNLRRSAIAALDYALAASYPYEYRKCQSNDFVPLNSGIITRHDNVANRLAEQFYLSHGASSVVRAIEVDTPSQSEEVQVMTTRYCLRRELGACMRTPEATKLVSPLTIRSANITYRLDFDCKNCRMKVIQLPR